MSAASLRAWQAHAANCVQHGWQAADQAHARGLHCPRHRPGPHRVGGQAGAAALELGDAQRQAQVALPRQVARQGAVQLLHAPASLRHSMSQVLQTQAGRQRHLPLTAPHTALAATSIDDQGWTPGARAQVQRAAPGDAGGSPAQAGGRTCRPSVRSALRRVRGISTFCSSCAPTLEG